MQKALAKLSPSKTLTPQRPATGHSSTVKYVLTVQGGMAACPSIHFNVLSTNDVFLILVKALNNWLFGLMA